MQRWLNIDLIYLDNARSICNIHSLIFADKTRRASHVRSIAIWIRRIEIPYSPSGVADRLLAILTCSDRLESIHILGATPSVVSFLGSLDTRIFPTIGNIPTLRHLIVIDGGLGTRELVRSVQSPLVSLDVHIDPSYWESGRCQLDQLTSLTSGVASTLEVLTVYSMELTCNGPVNAITPLPVLRSFNVCSARSYPRLKYFLRAFPALRDILYFGSGDQDPWWDPDYLHMRQIREENQQIQNTCRWVGIDYLECEALHFFTLGLRCPIRHAHILDCSALNRDYVRMALQDNPPSQLTVDIQLEHGLSVFEDLFPPPSATTLTHISVVLDYDSRDSPRDGDLTASIVWNELLVCLAPFCSPL